MFIHGKDLRINQQGKMESEKLYVSINGVENTSNFFDVVQYFIDYQGWHFQVFFGNLFSRSMSCTDFCWLADDGADQASQHQAVLECRP